MWYLRDRLDHLRVVILQRFCHKVCRARICKFCSIPNLTFRYSCSLMFPNLCHVPFCWIPKLPFLLFRYFCSIPFSTHGIMFYSVESPILRPFCSVIPLPLCTLSFQAHVMVLNSIEFTILGDHDIPYLQ